MATISMDLRQRILKTYDRGDITRAQVASRFDVSIGMFKKLIQQRRPPVTTRPVTLEVTASILVMLLMG
jgi:transposase